MRTREEIEKDTLVNYRVKNPTGLTADMSINAAQLEVLLDIRDLLQTTKEK